MAEKKSFNWNIIFLVTGLLLLEIIVLIALLGKWLIGTLRVIGWIVFGIILAGMIVWGVWYLIKFLWKEKEGEETKTLSYDDCMKLSNKILVFNYGIIPSTTRQSEQYTVDNVKKPVFFRKVYDLMEEKVVYVGIRLEQSMQQIGNKNPKGMLVLINPKPQEVMDKMMALSGTAQIKTRIEKTVLDEVGAPTKSVKVESEGEQGIDLTEEDEKAEKAKKELRKEQETTKK